MNFRRISQLIGVLNFKECISNKYIDYDISQKM